MKMGIWFWKYIQQFANFCSSCNLCHFQFPPYCFVFPIIIPYIEFSNSKNVSNIWIVTSILIDFRHLKSQLFFCFFSTKMHFHNLHQNICSFFIKSNSHKCGFLMWIMWITMRKSLIYPPFSEFSMWISWKLHFQDFRRFSVFLCILPFDIFPLENF